MESEEDVNIGTPMNGTLISHSDTLISHSGDNNTNNSIFKDKESVVKNSNLSDKVAALINIFFLIGSSIGPVVGGWLYDFIGFSYSFLGLSVFSFIFGIIYILITKVFYKSKLT